MQNLIEILGEILVSSLLDIWNNNKLNKYAKYACLTILSLFYVFIVIGLFILGINCLDKSIFAGLFVIIICLFIIYSIIVTIKKVF